MNKKIFTVSAACTALGIVNVIVFIVLLCLNIAPSIVIGNVNSVLFFLLYFAVVWLPTLFSWLFKTKFDMPFVIFYELFIVFSLLIGCIWRVYNISLIYDKIVHFSSGILFALFARCIVVQAKGVRLNPVWTFIIAFSFAMMAGGVWEIIEFSCDTFFGENAQSWMGFEGRAVLFDTMMDLICDCCGAIIGGIGAILIERRIMAKSASKAVAPNLNLDQSLVMDQEA